MTEAAAPGSYNARPSTATVFESDLRSQVVQGLEYTRMGVFCRGRRGHILLRENVSHRYIK